MMAPRQGGVGACAPTGGESCARVERGVTPRRRGLQITLPRAIALVACALFGVFANPTDARRRALVIGNDTYKNVTPLKNARSDARSIAAALRSLGFDVMLKEDLTDSALKATLREFKSRVEGGDEVVFYYSGHGVQFGGSNYLVPIDIVAENESQVADDAVPLQRVLDDLHEQKARFALAIVDACRDNPFKGQGRAIGGRGLAPVQAAKGQMVVYSAEAGESALDRLGAHDSNPNGVFTRVLIQQIALPGVPVDRMLKNVKSEVAQLAQSAGHEQVPAIYDGSLGDFYFRPGTAGQSAAPPVETVAHLPATAPAPTIHVPSAGELDESFWARIKDSNDVEDFKEYARQFSKGSHAPEAALMVRRLSRPAETARPVAAVSTAPVTGGAANWPAAPTGAPAAPVRQSYSGASTLQSNQLDKMVQQERQDFGVRPVTQIHSGQMHGPTPASIPGGKVITTKDLVALVQQNQTPYLLFDALGDAQTLPGALAAAWTAQPGMLGDSVEQQMGQQLYQATRGNRDVALIFYCRSSYCWMSYNAALRAIDLGYRNVMWYRGGIDSWTSAGLPTVASQQGY